MENMCASNKEEFHASYKNFVSNKLGQKPIVFEVFTKEEDENIE